MLITIKFGVVKLPHIFTGKNPMSSSSKLEYSVGFYFLILYLVPFLSSFSIFDLYPLF